MWSSTTARRRCRTTDVRRGRPVGRTDERCAPASIPDSFASAPWLGRGVDDPVALAVRDDGGGDLRTTTATVTSTLPDGRRPAPVHDSDHGGRRCPPPRRWSFERARTTSRSPPQFRQSPRPSRQRALAPTPSSSTTTGTASPHRRVPPSRSGWQPTGRQPDTPLYVGDELCIPRGRHGSGTRAGDDRCARAHRHHRRRRLARAADRGADVSSGPRRHDGSTDTAPPATTLQVLR